MHCRTSAMQALCLRMFSYRGTLFNSHAINQLLLMRRLLMDGKMYVHNCLHLSHLFVRPPPLAASLIFISQTASCSVSLPCMSTLVLRDRSAIELGAAPRYTTRPILRRAQTNPSPVSRLHLIINPSPPWCLQD